MKKLLIVDDEPDIRATLALLFAAEYEVFQACDGAEAVRETRARKPDLAFVDIMMPGMGGIATVRALKKLRPEIIVIMLTAQQDLRIAKRSLDHGASMYVTKPYDARFLRLEVERLLSCAAGHGPPPDDKPWRVV